MSDAANWWEEDAPAAKPAKSQAADDWWKEDAPAKAGHVSVEPIEEELPAPVTPGYDTSKLPLNRRPIEYTLPGGFEQLGPPLSDPGFRVSKPSPHTVPEGPRSRVRLPEIEVVGHRDKPAPPDTRPIADYGDVFNTDFFDTDKGWFQSPFASDLSTTIGARNEMKAVGVQEMLAAPAMQAKKRFWQALVLPDAFQRWRGNKLRAEAAGEPVPDLADDPLVRDAAERVGLGQRVDLFVRGLDDLAGMTAQELEAYKEENRAQIGPQEAQGEALANRRKLAAAIMGDSRPHFESEWSGPAVAFDLAQSVQDFAAGIGTGVVAGPAAGLATLGASVVPEEYAGAKNQGVSDTRALVYSLAKGAAEVIPETKAMEIITKSPAGKKFLERMLGGLAKGKLGHIGGSVAAEGASEMITEVLGVAIDKGIIDQDTSIGDALERIGRAGLLGGVMGGGAGALTSPLPEPAPEIPEWARRDGPPDTLPDYFGLTAPTPQDLASILAPKEEPRTEPFIPDSYWHPELPLRDPNIQPELPLPAGGVAEKPEPQPELPLGTIVAPASTGSRAPEGGAARASAPVAPPPQGTASPLSSAAQTSKAAEPAASPATPAPQEPAPASAPHAAPAVSTAQEPPAGEAASLSALRANQSAPVRRYEVDPRGGIETEDAVPWEELPAGWRKREYIAEFDGARNPVQELRTPAGKRYVRGIDHDGKPFDLSPSAEKLFNQFFDEGRDTPAAAPAPQAPAAAKPPAQTVKTGKRETVTTAVGTKVDTEYEVAEADDLVTSDKPEYPAHLQPRERGSRVSSQEQVSKMGGSIDPDLLGPSPHAEHGAPIIGSDDNNVESGNGRVMALRQMYSRDPERAEKYREMVAAQSGQDVSNMRSPVLVRRRKTPMTDAERVKFTKEANKTSVSRMSAGEQAKVDQDNLTPDVMAKLPEDMDEGFDLSKPAGQKFVTAFVSKFPVAERGELVDADGKTSSVAVTRAKAALLQKAYGGTPAGDAAIRRAVESTSSDAQTLINTLVRFAGPFAKLREDIAAGRIQDQADIGSKIAEAIEVVRSVDGPGGVNNWLATEDMLNPKDPVVKQLIETFYSFDGRGYAKRLRTAGAIGSTLNEYLTLAQGYTAEQAGGGLFGDEAATPKLDPAAALGKLNTARRDQEQKSERQAEAAAKAQQGLFTARGEPSGPVPTRPSDEDSGTEAPAAGPRESGDESDAQAREEREEAELEREQQEYGRKREADVREFRQLKKTDPEFKRISKDVHPESGAASDTFQGWKDAKAGKPIDPQRAQSMLPTADMRPHGFNPVQGYLVGYAAALGMKPPLDIRAFDALDWLRKVAAEQERQFEPAASQDEEMTDIDEDVGTTAATEDVAEDEGGDYGDEVPYDTEALGENLSGKTGTVPRGPNIPGKTTAVDPLQTIGQRKAEEIAAQIEKERQAEVAPKRESELKESRYDAIWRDLHGGMHPGESQEEYAARQDAFVKRMRNAPIRAQIEYVSNRLKLYYDFKGIKLDPALNTREQLDAMLDAYNNLRLQSSIMGQPKEAMGFNGQLTMELTKKIGASPDTRGQFSWKFGQGFGASVLALARRADSFTHEWLHALDLNLLMRFTQRRAIGVSGASNLTMTPLPELPKPIHDAFTRVMRAILLTDEASMKKMADLTVSAQQTQEALTKAKQKLRKTQGVFDNREEREKKAEQYDKDADRSKDPFLAAGRRRAAEQLRTGNRKAAAALAAQKAEVAKLEAKLKQIDADMKDTLTSKASALAQGSRFVDFMQGRKYFSIPAELFARAGESWMGNRIGQQAGVEFLSGSPNYYNSHSDELMALVYPNEADRTRIFAAFDDLFTALAAEQYFAGETVAAKIPQPDRLEKELWLAAQRNAEVSAARAALQATQGDLAALGKLFGKMAHPVQAAKDLAEGTKNISLSMAEGFKQVLYQFYTGRGRLNGMIATAKAAGNLRLAARLRKFARLLTDDPGSGELQEETLEQEFVRQSTADLNEFHGIVEKHKLDPDDDAQMAELYDELAKPNAQVRAEMQDYKEFLQDKLAATKGDRNKVRTAEALKFQIAALDKKMARFDKPPTASSKILDAADEIRTLMNTAYYRQQNAGIDMGFVSNYMNRALDDEAINENRAGFVEQAQAVYEFELHRKARALNRKLGQLENELRVAKSVARNLERGQDRVDAINKQMGTVRAEIAELANVDTLRQAQDWLYSSQVADMFQADRSTPPSNYTKARKLGPIADILMSDFYDQNPLSSIQRYLPMAAKRAAYSRRFGSDHSKYEQMRHEFLAAGMEPDDLKTVDELLKIMAGTYSANISKGLRSVTDTIYNTATNALLPFSLFAQLAEPLSAGIRTGRIRDGLMNVFYTGQQIFRGGNAAEMRQVADIMGIISSAGTDTIVQSRMFQEDMKGSTARIANFFYRVTGVHGYTAASRIATMKLGGRYINSWADAFLSSKIGSKERAAAEEEFRELGIPPKLHEAFAKYVQKQGDMMSINALLQPEDAELKQHYVVATHRFVDTIIGNPKASDRARMASNPVGRFIMSISSFNYFFQRHVLARFGKRFQRSDQKMRTMIQFTVPFMALMVGTMMARLLREWIQDKDKFEKRVEDLATVKGFFNAIDASGGTGGFSPLYNWLFKSRYQKEMSTLAMGAAMGFYVDSVQDIYDGFADVQDPMDHTSTAERKRARAFYRLIMNSAAPRILESVGLRGPLGWAALTYATSYNTANDFASLTVGKTANEKYREAQEAKKRPPSPAQEARKKARADKKQKDIEKRYGP